MTGRGAPLVARVRLAVAPAAGLVVFFGLWELLVRAFGVQAFIMPPPSRAVRSLVQQPGFFAHEGAVTAWEAAVGLMLAFALALALAVPMARRRVVERAIQPVAVFVQLIPLVVYAPAFVIWMRPGFRPIVAVAALFALLPLVYNLTAGLKAADPDTVDVLRSAGASPGEILRKVEIPTALPYIFAGLRTAVGLALIGAVLCEWFALRSHGLGRQIQKGIASANATLIWSSAFALAAVGTIALLALVAAERLTTGGRATSGAPRGDDRAT
jgi:NitT/TauT family transport system permease protein